MSQPHDLPAGFSDVALLLDELKDGVSIINRDWTILFNNASALALAQRPWEALVGQNLWALYPDLEGSAIGAAYRRAMASGKPETVEEYYAEADFFLELRVFPRAEGLLVLTRDVSEMRRAQRDLTAVKDRYQLVLRATQDALWEWDLASNAVTWNEWVTEQYGHLDQTWTTEQRWNARIHPEDRYAVRKSLDEALADPTMEMWSAEYRINTLSAGYAWVVDHGAILRDDAGVPRCMVGALKDVTARRAAKAAAAHRAREHKLLAELGMAYTQSPTPRALLEACTQAIVDALDACLARAWLLSKDGSTLHLVASAGLQVDHSAHERIPLGADKIGGIAQAQAALISSDIATDPRVRDAQWASAMGAVGFAGVPLLLEGRTLGVVAIFARHAIPQARIDLLRHVCEIVAVSIERFRVVRRIEQSERRFRSFVESTANIVWSANREGAMNGDVRSWCTFTGQTEAHARAHGGYDAVHPKDRDRLTRGWLAAVEAESPSFESEYRLRRHDGRYRAVRLRAVPVRNEHGKVVEWVGTIMDNTALRDAEAALVESEDRFQKIADSAPVILWVTDSRGTCVSLNQSWYDFTGAPPGRVPADPWADYVHPDDLSRLRSARHTFAHHHEPYRAEYRLRDATGEYRWMLDSALPRLDGGAEYRGYVGCLFDISERKLVERERERLLHREADARREAEDANRLKDEFLAAVSHELRTPLNAVLGWAQMLRRGVLSETQQAGALETIERNARLQSQLIEDLLDVSRIVSGKLRLDLEPVNLCDVIEQAVASVQPAADKAAVTVLVDVDDQPTVIGDSARLQQIIWNLLSNGVKFTPAGGQVLLTSRQDGDAVVVRVIDTGAGIAPDFIEQVFDRFRQASAGSARQRTGLGLGLAIVRSLAELHGGSIEAHSAGLGQGATFTLRLPVTREDAPRRSGELTLIEVDDLPSLEGLNVLIVDDERDAREVLEALLLSRGATVYVEERAADALTRLQVVLPDLLLSDIGMPDMDGYTLIAHVRALPPNRGGNTPALALTAYARPQDRAKALMAGFQSHIPKPVEPAELMAVIQSVLGVLPSS